MPVKMLQQKQLYCMGVYALLFCQHSIDTDQNVCHFHQSNV